MCAVKMCPFELSNLAYAKSTGINTEIDADLRIKEITPESCCFHRFAENPWRCGRHCPLCRYENCSTGTSHLTLRRIPRGRIPI